MSLKIHTEGAQLKLIQRLQCMKENAESLQEDLEALEAARDECCSEFENLITMDGSPVTEDDETVTMED